jgi:hypothetical protein
MFLLSCCFRMGMSDEILFAEDTNDEIVLQGKARQGKARQGKARQGKARVLIVYDEPEVHAVTVLALKDFVFQEKHLEFINTFI